LVSCEKFAFLVASLTEVVRDHHPGAIGKKKLFESNSARGQLSNSSPLRQSLSRSASTVDHRTVLDPMENPHQ